MSQIKLTPEELRQSANRYSEGSQTVNDILVSLSNEQNIIAENWDGQAFDRFEQQFEELKPKVQEFAELLESIKTQLVSVADTLEQTDQDIASQIG